MIMRKLLEVLARDGVKPIEALGAPFDPRLHEAVATRAGGCGRPHHRRGAQAGLYLR